MKKNKLLAALLSLTVVLATLPAATSTAEAEDNSNSIAVQATTGWQPKATRTVTSSNFPLTVSNGDVLQINGPINYTAATGKSPITVASGAKAKIIINGSVTLNGANANGTTGATAAIYVPDGATLTIYSAHDEELSTKKDTPKDTLTLKGGNAAVGANGVNAEKRENTYTGGSGAVNTETTWHSGSGGNGGGGAAAAIGGNGGSGGYGGIGLDVNIKIVTNLLGSTKSGKYDDNPGKAGNNGSSGASGKGAGIIYVSGRLNLKATGGSAAKGGNGGSGCGGYANTSGNDTMIGGCGGGGGGGGGLAAPAIGAGGAGGAGGGSGGTLSSDHKGNVQGCGGGGGGGGWPNGGGGGGGGAECTKAETKNDNKSKGGAGGAGGAAGAAGSKGIAGTSTGTNGHGINNKGIYDAAPGNGGGGGTGIGKTTGAYASGGAGGQEKDHSYNGGTGGSGGKSTDKTSWNTQGNLILSTANNLTLTSPTSLSYMYGDGQGQGSMSAITPYIIYDIIDCKVSLQSCTYPGADNQATTKITSITYNSSTDRDKSIIGSSKTIATNRVSLAYTNRKHCSSGTVAVTGANNSTRTTVMTNNAVIGVSNLSFKINKATINNVPISGNFTGAKQNVPIAVSVSTYRISSTASYKSLSTLCKSSGEIGTPTVKWSVTSGSGTFADANSSSTTFTPSSSGSVTIKVALSEMNDFNDYSKTITFSTTKRDLNSLTFSTNTPHPRNDVSVILPDDIGDDATIQWYTVSGTTATAITGATKATYTVRNADIGKSLRVKVTPSANSNYNVTTTTATISNTVENHNYTQHNGFCTICGEYQPASLSGSTYSIANGGQMFWFAAMVNNDPTHAEFNKQNTSANAVLSQDIDLENRDWTPIGEKLDLTDKEAAASNNETTIEVNAYKGTFKGLDATKTISNLKITGAHLRTGLFATALNATLENFAVEGTITLPQENIYFNSNYNCVGGIVGKMNGTKISGVVSNVDIVNTDGYYKHVGGVIGEVHNVTTNITKCLYEGEIHIINSNDCVGGIVGYTNQGAQISYCANLGIVSSVKGAATASPFAGGILGYVNNQKATVKNCYNYGTVSNGGLSYEGAIVGCINKKNASNTEANFTDNYYLNGSAPNGFGKGSTDITAPIAKDKEAFASGEVCYLVNGKTSTKSKAIWRQNVDNTYTPYDDYPLFWTYDDAIVYYHSDDTYSNYAESVSVDISWGDMSFEYKNVEWDPGNHTYGGAWEPVTEDGNKITVTNNSNIAVKAGFKFTPVSNITDMLSNFEATISGETSLRL